MLEYIQTFCSLTFNIFNMLFFCFLYIPLFNKCNVKKKVKKNGKTKIISQPKSILAFIYLFLLVMLFKCFTFKMIIFILICLVIGSLVFFDELSPKLNEVLYKYNKSNYMILSWKILHTFFAIINIITQPLFSAVNNLIYKKLYLVKNFIIQVANFSGEINDFDFMNEKKLHNELLKISEEMTNISMDTTDKTDVSGISGYVQKSKTKCEKNKIKELDEMTESTETFSTKTSISDINSSDLKTSQISSKDIMEKKINMITNDYMNSNDSCEEINITLSDIENKKNK